MQVDTEGIMKVIEYVYSACDMNDMRHIYRFLQRLLEENRDREEFSLHDKSWGQTIG